MKKFLINVNGKTYDVAVEEVHDNAPVVFNNPAPQLAPIAAPSAPVAPAPVAAPAPAAAPAANVSGTKVSSPMPGTILKINVAVGDTVKEGDVVVVLEAMKMENDIPTTVGGKVVAINVNQGNNVSAGDTLVVIG